MDFFLKLIGEVPDLTNLKNFFEICFYILTPFVAYKGLNKWAAKEKYSSAKNLVLTIYKIKEGVGVVRNPMIWAHEFPENYSPTSDRDKRYKAHLAVYQNRLEEISKNYPELNLYTLEVKTFLEDKVEKEIIEFRNIIRELQLNIGYHLENMGRDGISRFSFKENGVDAEKNRAVIYTGINGDKYFDKLENSIKRLENILKTYLV